MSSSYQTKHATYLPQTWVDPRLVKGQSDIAGFGLFTIAPIRQGETLMIWGGQVIEGHDIDETKYRYQTIVPIDEARYLALPIADTRESLDEWLNHSCDPNCWLNDEVTVVARHPIRAHEEITLDFVTWCNGVDDPYTDDGSCLCGASICRKQLTSEDWKIPELQVRYKGHFSPYLEKRISTFLYQKDQSPV